MSSEAAVGGNGPVAVNSRLMRRVFYVLLTLALVSAVISIGGRYYGGSIAQGGHTVSTLERKIFIGNNVIVAPENTIRFADARRDGVTSRLDLYVRWPDFKGYSAATRADFNHEGGSRNLLFLTFQEKTMSRDMSGRFDPIYSSLIARPGIPEKAGLIIYDFKKKSGYLDEQLAVAELPGHPRFVARCLKGPAARNSLAPCDRDIDVGDNMSLTVRFPAALLPNWIKLEAALRAHVQTMLKAR